MTLSIKSHVVQEIVEIPRPSVELGPYSMCSLDFTGVDSILVIPSLSTKFIKIASRICQFSQYLGTKLDMLFGIAKSVAIVIISGKTAILP